MKKILTLFAGMILTVVLLFGGVGFMLLKKGGVGDLTGLISGIQFSDEIKKMSVLDYIKNVQNVLGNFNAKTLGEIEDAIGLPLTAKVAEMLGIDPEALRKANIETLPNAILNSFTVETLESKFGITLPDMPIFKTEEFRTKPLTEAFELLSEKLNPEKMRVKDLEANFGIILSDNPMFQDPAIANAYIANLGEALNEVQLASMLGVVYRSDVDKFNGTHVQTQEEIDAWVQGKVSYADWVAGGKLGEFDYFDTEVEQAAYIEEYNAVEPAPTPLLIDQWTHLRQEEQKSILDALTPPTPPDPEIPPSAAEGVPPDGYEFAKPVAPLLLVEGQIAPTESTALIKKLSVNKLGDMTVTGGSDTVINNIINNSTLGEIIEIKETDQMLYSLRNSKISEIEADMKKISLNVIMTVDGNSSLAMKYLVTVPLRDELNPWQKGEGGEYLLDADGKRIPNYVQAKDADGNLIFTENPDGGAPIPVYVYATIETLDAKIKQMVIGDILPESDDPNVILAKVKYSNLDNLESDLNIAMNDTTIGELVKTPEGEEPSPILKVLSDKKISELNQAMNDLTVADVIPFKEGEHSIITKLRDNGTKIADIGTALNEAVNTSTLGELMTIDENSSSILFALKDVQIQNLDTAMKQLTIVQMFGEDELYEANADDTGYDRSKPKGVLGLIDYMNRDASGNGTTTLENIAANSTGALTNAKLADLRMVGLLPSDDSITSKAVDMMIEQNPNTTLMTLPEAMINLMMKTTLGKLIDGGLITLSGGSPLDESLKNMTIQQIIEAVNATGLPTVP